MKNPHSKPKANLKLVPAKAEKLRLGGLAPSEEMQPGKYLVVCETAWVEPVGKQHRAVLQFRVLDGRHDGVSLRLWVTASDGGGIVSPTSRFARYCAIALGRPLNTDDPVGEPSEIFAGQKFVVFVGYRKTEHAKGGSSSDERALTRKDTADFLRVHDIVSREDL
jgi:hypothetical protein